MFVLKSTLAKVEAERDEARAERDAANEVATTWSETAARADNDFRLAIAVCRKLEGEAAALKAELAKTYVHDAKGRIARHPSAAK